MRGPAARRVPRRHRRAAGHGRREAVGSPRGEAARFADPGRRAHPVARGRLVRRRPRADRPRSRAATRSSRSAPSRSRKGACCSARRATRSCAHDRRPSTARCSSTSCALADLRDAPPIGEAIELLAGRAGRPRARVPHRRGRAPLPRARAVLSGGCGCRAAADTEVLGRLWLRERGGEAPAAASLATLRSVLGAARRGAASRARRRADDGSGVRRAGQPPRRAPSPRRSARCSHAEDRLASVAFGCSPARRSAHRRALRTAAGSGRAPTG